MGAKHFGRALLVALLCPGAAWALGLGDIKLNSALNAPLDADIELLGAAPDELSSLKAQLASRETFAKYGLEYPGFLSSVSLARGKSASGRDVLRVTSQESITEPFVTLLVDVNWGRGRLVREYTVLLDPPVFTPGNSQAAPVSQAGTGSARSGTIERTAPAAPAAAAPSADGSVATSDQTYNVRRGDTLSGIAGRLAGSYAGSTRDQLMLALYRSNPTAFDGTMNQLRNGSILRLPAASALSAISASAASAEATRQYSAWRGRGSGSGSGPGRLRLVAPNETGNGSSATAADVKSLRDRLSQLETELTESRRMLELKNAELADLQRRLGASAAAGAPAAAGTPPTSASTTKPAPAEAQPPAAPEAAPAAAPPAAAAAGTEPKTEPAPVAPAAEGAAATPAATPSAEAPKAEPVKPRRRVVEEAPVEEPSFLSSLLGSVKSAVADFWYIPVALLAALLAFFGFRKFRAGRSSGDEFAVARYDEADTHTSVEHGLDDEISAVTERPAEQAKARRPAQAAPAPDRGMLVEESGEVEQPKFASSTALRSEDTLSGETGINLDQSDPLAEADFHMAYGLYDQAADLVRTAILREPNRRDLKLKLVEVFFVWGNRDEFLATARELYATRAEAAAGEWDKIVIMGRQIAPEDPLFSGAAPAAGRTEAVDLDLHPGEAKLDFDLLNEGTTAGGSSSHGSTNSALGAAALGAAALGSATATLGSTGNGLDLDFSGTASGLHISDVDLDLSEKPAAAEHGEGDAVGDTAEFTAAFAPADRSGATTREMAPQFAPSVPELEDLASDLGEAPTVEQPLLRTNSPTIRQKIDAVLRQANTANDQTAEVAIDDLGLDLGDGLDLDAHDVTAGHGSAPAAPSGAAAHNDGSADAPTLVAGLDAESRDLIQSAAASSGADSTIANTGEWFTGTKTERDTAATASMRALDVDLSEHADAGATAQLLRPKDLETDLAQLPQHDVDDTGTAAALPNGEELSLPALEPMTISEVGTKLDLARAYMDMGDPDGARSILKEVLQEGSISQKQEAQRLIDSLPG